jgi:hypothetical protein
MQATGGVLNARDNVVDGKYGAAILDGVGVLGNIALMTRACFTGDMQVLTRHGWVRWDELKVGDEVACCDENNPHGTIEYRPVEELFVTRAPIWHVQVNGRLIRTTAEHPFWVWGKGWVAARRLEVGDRLRSADGQEVAVEEVIDTGLEETVYNCRIADYHTYFVGTRELGFSVWAHNACAKPITSRSAHGGPLHNGTMVSEALAFSGLPGVTGVRTNQALVDTAGRTLSLLRPDIQYVQGGLVHIIEVNVSRGAGYHAIREAQLRSILGSLFGSYKGI